MAEPFRPHRYQRFVLPPLFVPCSVLSTIELVEPFTKRKSNTLSEIQHVYICDRRRRLHTCARHLLRPTPLSKAPVVGVATPFVSGTEVRVGSERECQDLRVGRERRCALCVPLNEVAAASSHLHVDSRLWFQPESLSSEFVYILTLFLSMCVLSGCRCHCAIGLSSQLSPPPFSLLPSSLPAHLLRRKSRTAHNTTATRPRKLALSRSSPSSVNQTPATTWRGGAFRVTPSFPTQSTACRRCRPTSVAACALLAI